MHLVPEDRRGHRMLDGDRVCRAIEAVGDRANVANWAGRFAILGDPTRLALLLAIAEAGPISVTDVAAATAVNDTTVSQALRLLRASGTVVAERDGRVMRYVVADGHVAELLHCVVEPAWP
jgi:ArsR family transcriptional regulator, lead/cadmium/zinc/bismuth-responsive transcriptional repressor